MSTTRTQMKMLTTAIAGSIAAALLLLNVASARAEGFNPQPDPPGYPDFRRSGVGDPNITLGIGDPNITVGIGDPNLTIGIGDPGIKVEVSPKPR